MLRKGVIILIIGLFIGASFVPSITSESWKTNNAKVTLCNDDCDIIVDNEGDGNTIHIQDAIDIANPGDTICVYSGTYVENVIIDKQVNLIGIDEELGEGDDTGKPVIDGGNNGDIVTFKEIANGIRMSGFHLINSGYVATKTQFDSAIKVLSSDNIITGNEFTSNPYGIFLSGSTSNKIEQNQFFSNKWGGICISTNSPSNIILNNSFIDDGLMFYVGTEGVISNWNSHIIQDNEINGKTLYYFANCNGIEIPEDAGQIFLVNCSDCIVSNLNISYTIAALDLSFSSHILVMNNNFSNNRQDGMHIIHSHDCIVSNNIFTYNLPSAIYLMNADDNAINNNQISNNGNKSLKMPAFNGGIIIQIESNNNLIFNNNFINNSWFQVYNTVNIDNMFDNGTIGNFWSDNLRKKDDNYDGISDIPYYVPLTGIDNYPLMWPFGMPYEEIPPKLEVEIPKEGYLHFCNNIIDPIPSRSGMTGLFAAPTCSPLELKVRASDDSGWPTVWVLIDDYDLEKLWTADFFTLNRVTPPPNNDLYKGKLDRWSFGKHTLTFIAWDRYANKNMTSMEVFCIYFPRPTILP